MNLHLQRACDQLVRKNQTAFVELRRDVISAVRRTAELWEPVFEDPCTIHGQLHCTSVRGLLIKCREDREGALLARRIRPPLRTHCGQGMSVVLTDPDGNEMRVRKSPAEMYAGDRQSLLVHPQAAFGDQLSFGPEYDELEAVPANYRWYVIWTLSPDSIQVPQVFLAAIGDIDDPARVVVLASAPLPRAATQPQSDDFEDYGKPEEGSGPTDSA